MIVRNILALKYIPVMSSLPNDKVKLSFHRVKNQFLMVFIGKYILFGTKRLDLTIYSVYYYYDTGNILAFSQGTNIGWYSPALPVINSIPSYLLDGPISQATAGWLGAAVPIGCLIGNLGFGLMANWIGYKGALQLATIPEIVRKLSRSFSFGESI